MDDFNHGFTYEKILHSLESQLFKEKNTPGLLDQLHIQQNHISVSGHKDGDYPVVNESVGGSIRISKTSAIPKELQERTKEMRQNCLMGIFRDIDRIWLTVDSDLFIWNYENGSDLAYYDGCCDTILAIELIKPKPGVFNPCIHYLLVLAGQVEILVLGVSICGYKNNTLELLPEPLFKIATDNEHITVIQDINGRIILGTKSGNVLEISYWAEKPSWFKFGQSSVYNTLKYAFENDFKLCAKLLNHSTWKLSMLLPNVIVNGLMINEPIVQIAVDASRNAFYTRSDSSLIAQYQLLPNDGLQRINYISEDSFVSKAYKSVKSVEKHQFRNIIELCPLGIGYGPLQLMAITRSGVRLYFMDNLQLCHVRMPPASQSSMYGKISNVRLCCESRGSVLMVCGTSIDNQALFTISPDAYILPELIETVSVSWAQGSSWFLVPLDKNDNKKHLAHPVIQTQHLDPLRRFLMVSVDSIIQLELPSPIHHLREILEKTQSPQCPQIESWILHYGPEETIYAALVIASDKKNAFVSSRATEVVLYHLNEIIKKRAMSSQSQTRVFYDQINPLHQVLCMYAARILRPLWDNCIGENYKPNPNETYINSTHDCEELAWFLHHLNHLNDFIRDHYPRLRSIDLMRTSNSVSAPNSLALELLELLKCTVEIVGLWRMLTEHQFHHIIKLLSPEMQNELLRCPVKQLLLPNKRPLLLSLIGALLQHYSDDGASTESVIDALLRICPNLYSKEDAICSRANEILLNVDSLNNSKPIEQEIYQQKRENLLIKAIQLYEQVGPGIDLGSVIFRLRAVGCTWGAVHLCLHAAKLRDPQDYAIKSLKEGLRPQSTIEINAIEGRSDAYKYLLECLASLLEMGKYSVINNIPSAKKGSVQDINSLFPNNEIRNNALTDLNVILTTIFDRKDDIMVHFEVYSWMIENDLSNQILEFNTEHLELYLQERLMSDPQSVEAKNLLWKHYELQGRLLEAAKVLDNLAITECSNFGLDERLGCISRAIVFVRAVIGGNENFEIDYLKELEDKVEIFHLQKVIIEEIGSRNEKAVNDLNSRLFKVSQLVQDFAEPFDLTVSKLSILKVSGKNYVTAIRLIWEELIEKEINKLNHIISKETREVSLKQTIMQVASRFKDSPSFLPLDLILSHIESYCDTYDYSPEWAISCFTAIDISIVKIIQAYFEVTKMKDQDIRKHLNRVYNSLCIALGIFLISQVNTRECQIYSSQFLDIVTSCLIELQSKTDKTTNSLVEKFKSYKSLLEQNV